jgi:PAS domain S-box-containing protein
MKTKTARVESEIALKRQNRDHEHMLSELLEQFMPVFSHSPDGVYLYLDENHKVCNTRMADMFGLTVEEWRKVPNFLESFVAAQDRELFASNYGEHVAELKNPVSFRFHGVRKNGEIFLAETEMIPFSWNGHPIAYHFVREIR